MHVPEATSNANTSVSEDESLESIDVVDSSTPTTEDAKNLTQNTKKNMDEFIKHIQNRRAFNQVRCMFQVFGCCENLYMKIKNTFDSIGLGKSLSFGGSRLPC